MDNSKYIKALDELISYYRSRIEQLEHMKLDAATNSDLILPTITCSGGVCG